MTTTSTRRRKAPAVTTTLLTRVQHLLTQTPLSVSQVATKLKTNKRYVRELADTHSLPTNRHVTPGGRLAHRIASDIKTRGVTKVRASYRFSRAKLSTVLNSL